MYRQAGRGDAPLSFELCGGGEEKSFRLGQVRTWIMLTGLVRLLSAMCHRLDGFEWRPVNDQSVSLDLLPDTPLAIEPCGYVVFIDFEHFGTAEELQARPDLQRTHLNVG